MHKNSKQSEANLDETGFSLLINKAARQRMLSQRTGLLLLNISSRQARHGGNVPSLTAELQKTLQDFDEAHVSLQQNARQYARQISLSATMQTGSPSPAEAIARFQTEMNVVLTTIQEGRSTDEQYCLNLSDFILSDLIGALQANVDCLEGDFRRFVESNAKQTTQRKKTISKAVEKIKSAAHKSKMIAFNAKIAAARAGEQGREFGALTDEIKDMSEWITKSSSDIIACEEI